MPRWLHGTFRRFGKIGVQAYIHAHRYTYVCMHTYKERKREIEKEIKLLGKVLSLKLHKDVQASIIFYQIPVGLILSILAYCPYDKSRHLILHICFFCVLCFLLFFAAWIKYYNIGSVKYVIANESNNIDRAAFRLINYGSRMLHRDLKFLRRGNLCH